MKPGDSDPGNLLSGPARLLPLALSRPNDALLAAGALIAGQPTAYDASLAHHAIGIVQRNRGDLPGAIAELQTALKLARASGKREREIDVQATLGVALAWAGRTERGLALLDQAVASSRGVDAGRVLMRRASVLRDVGRLHEAREDLRRALPIFRRVGDTVWEARSLTHRAEIFLALGLPGRAGADFARAEELFAANGQQFEYASARHNRGLLALNRGQLPEALTYLEEAGRLYESLGETWLDLVMDRCSTLMAAGLAREATREADAALSQLPRGGGEAYKRAELLFTAAAAALTAGNPAVAGERARRARRLFRAQARDVWEARAGLILAQARYASGERSVSLARQVDQVADRLEESRAADAMRAHLLAGRLALDTGRTIDVDQHLERAARARRRGPPLNRSVAWLARALQADARGNVRATRIACSRGLDAISEHQRTLGATELRAHGTAHGAELAVLAQRDALKRGDARRLLLWTERWRATALATRGTLPRQARELAGDLAALRNVTRLLDVSEMAASRRAALQRERRRLEAAVQASTRRSPGSTPQRPGAFDLGTLLDELGQTTMVELVEVDGVLHAIVISGRRVRVRAVGGVPAGEVDMTRFVLRRLARGRLRPGDELALAHRARKLESGLLGPAAAELGDGPVVVIPPGRLSAVPWTLMPALRDRAVTVAPSASTWLRARRRKPPPGRRVTLVAGPGLVSGEAEIPRLRSRYPGAAVFSRGSATAEPVLRALDGAWLAHIAAHGTFRAENPLFSSITLDDGPLTVHDFERLRQAPHWLVLSSCDSGVGAAVGADELLGLASSLVPLGAAGIVASVVPVNDAAAVPVMLALHDALGNGGTLPGSLLAARTATRDDLMARATAYAFTALGA
ncbi:MAG TPA: CHAT domain-containing tetratricopeptide repeat protein [Streptosporangiaceae bacterium]